MFFLYGLAVLILFFLVVLGCKLNFTHQELKTTQTKNEQLYHDINSSLVIFKLALTSLKECSLEKNTTSMPLIEALEENIGHMEGSFRHWNL